MAAKMATIVGDVIGLQERHHLLMTYLILLRRSKAFHCFEILQHIKNSRGGFHPPPAPLVLLWECEFECTSEG